MSLHKCNICNLEFKTKQNLEKHTNKRYKCNVITPYKCDSCIKYFRNNISLVKHKDNNVCGKEVIKYENNENELKIAIKSCLTCSINNDDKILLLTKYNNQITKEELNLIIDSNMNLDGKISMIYTLIINKNNNNVNNINNGTINTVNNIMINNFGQEKLDYLDNDYFKNLIMNNHIENSYMKLMNDIYLNKDHPENNTVKVENINNKYALVFNNGKWDSILKYELKELLHQKNHTILKMHYNKLKDLMTTGKKDEIRVFLTRDDTSDPHMMYMIDRVILLFYNGKELYEVGKINN
jgi:hypothetical protein